MRKITKLSLTAILAIGAMSSANAQNLVEALKNVDVSGTAAYRYNDYETSGTTNLFKIAADLKAQVNDDVTFNSRIIAGNKDNAGEVVLDSSDDSDANVDLFISEVNFDYTGIDNTKITLGKQAIATPFTIARDAMGNEATGTGVVASTKLGMVSLAGGYFNQTNFDNNDAGLTIDGENLYFVAGNITIANATLDAAYADVQDQFDAYTVGLSGNYEVSGVALSPYARYSSLDLDNSNLDNTLWKVGMGAQAGIYGAYLAYGETGKDGGTVGTDYSSDTGMDDHWRVTLSTISDASVVYASVNAQVTDTINLAVKYSDLNAGTNSNDKDQNEIYGQAVYQMSKNFMTFARFGQLEYDGNKSNMGRLHVQYSF